MKLNDIKIVNAILEGNKIHRQAWNPGRYVDKDGGMDGVTLEDSLSEDWEVEDEH